ncbi:hypothetical protein BJV82DRAFT_669530 [Fennellomyces sp. T-0311]|nr:hypothetical protein BJV82DRAFT_669530 [Fennellomyces sp. T-0311]
MVKINVPVFNVVWGGVKQSQYLNSHAHYFSCVILSLFIELTDEIIMKQTIHVLAELLNRLTVSTMVHEVGLTILVGYREIRQGTLNNPFAMAIEKKHDKEFTSRYNKFKTIRCLRLQRVVDPTL